MSFQLLAFHLAYNKLGIETIERYYSIFDRLITSWLDVTADGSIKTAEDDTIIHQYINKEQIIPMVQNLKLDGKVSNYLISSEKAVNRFIFNSLTYLKEKGYKELCIDIEGVKYDNKEKYTKFISETASVLHNAGYYLSIAIPAKSENNQDSTWSGAYDYKLLGEIVDRVIIMAYDFHWPGGPPGPIAPINWLQDVIDFAIIEIPLEKIYFALGLYAYDWPLNLEGKARGLIYKQVESLAVNKQRKIEWDQESQTPYLKYEDNGVEHEIWFENKRSIEMKIKLINEFQLKGVAFWRLGQEDPGVWELFNRKKF